MSIDWNQFERASGDFNRWKPEKEGDEISGIIKTVRIATMPDGNRYPSLTISTGGIDYDVLASQTQLLRLLAEKKPQPGDLITIKHTRVERLAGGKTMKHFTVEIVKGKQTDANDII